MNGGIPRGGVLFEAEVCCSRGFAACRAAVREFLLGRGFRAASENPDAAEFEFLPDPSGESPGEARTMGVSFSGNCARVYCKLGGIPREISAGFLESEFFGLVGAVSIAASSLRADIPCRDAGACRAAAWRFLSRRGYAIARDCESLAEFEYRAPLLRRFSRNPEFAPRRIGIAFDGRRAAIYCLPCSESLCGCRLEAEFSGLARAVEMAAAGLGPAASPAGRRAAGCGVLSCLLFFIFAISVSIYFAAPENFSYFRRADPSGPAIADLPRPPENGAAADVMLVPVAGFPAKLANGMAECLSKDLNLNVKVGEPMPFPEGSYNPSRRQYRAEAFSGPLLSHTAAARDAGWNTFRIALVESDIYMDSAPGLRFVFSAYSPSGCMTLGTARMKFRASEGFYRQRIFKILKRGIGRAHLRKLQVDDKKSLMRKDVSGLEDLDEMGFEF